MGNVLKKLIFCEGLYKDSTLTLKRGWLSINLSHVQVCVWVWVRGACIKLLERPLNQMTGRQAGGQDLPVLCTLPADCIHHRHSGQNLTTTHRTDSLAHSQVNRS